MHDLSDSYVHNTLGSISFLQMRFELYKVLFTDMCISEELKHGQRVSKIVGLMQINHRD